MAGKKNPEIEKTKAVYQRNKKSRDRHLEEKKPGAIIRDNPDYAAIIKTIEDEGRA